MTDHEKIEAFALIWRQMGQPDTKDLYVICEADGSWADMGDTLLGMPLLRGCLYGSDVPLSLASVRRADEIQDLRWRFEKHARAMLS
jgi:hypothetical protein